MARGLRRHLPCFLIPLVGVSVSFAFPRTPVTPAANWVAPLTTPSPEASTAQGIRVGITHKQMLVRELCAGQITTREAFDRFQLQLPVDTHVIQGLRIEFGERTVEELSALNLILMLNQHCENEPNLDILTNARCEFESRFGHRLWQHRAQHGVCPLPPERVEPENSAKQKWTMLRDEA